MHEWVSVALSFIQNERRKVWQMCLGGVLRSFVGLVSVLVSQDQQYNQHRWSLPEVNEIKNRSNLKDWSGFFNLMNLLEFIKSVFMVRGRDFIAMYNYL